MLNSRVVLQRLRAIIPCVLLTGFVILFFSCGLRSEVQVTLLTSESILHLYAEYYNAHQDGVYIDVQDSSNPIGFRNLPGQAPDLIVQPNPADGFQTSWFRTLNLTQPGDTYPQLVSLFKDKSDSTMLPLSFSLPIIVWHDRRPGSRLPLTAGLQQLTELTTVEGGDHLTHIGFSPSWNPRIPLWYLRANRTSLSLDRSGSPTWDDQEISQAAEVLRDWIQANIGSRNQVSRFSDTYMYVPFYDLLRQGRISYYPSDLREFFGLPPFLREGLDFAWYGSSGRIPVSSSVIYAAIPANSHTHREATTFLKWLIDPVNQDALMEYVIEQRLPEFGFLGGLSSSVRTNERFIPLRFPEMEVKSPVTSRLIFPELLPWFWNDLEHNVLEPYFQEAVLSDEPPPSEELRRRIERWISQLGSD